MEDSEGSGPVFVTSRENGSEPGWASRVRILFGVFKLLMIPNKLLCNGHKETWNPMRPDTLQATSRSGLPENNIHLTAGETCWLE